MNSFIAVAASDISYGRFLWIPQRPIFWAFPKIEQEQQSYGAKDTVFPYPNEYHLILKMYFYYRDIHFEELLMQLW